jgi:twinkle protein
MMPSADRESQYLFKVSCSTCGSSDANAVYDDGHTFCFACSAYVAGQDEAGTPSRTKGNPLSKDLLPLGDISALPKRGLTEETCRRWGYFTTSHRGSPVQVAQYADPDTGEWVAQKVRGKDKEFSVLGDLKAAGLYGQQLWRTAGKRIIITEGEIDAMTVSQALDHKWPVVSVPNGAQGAERSLTKALPWLSTFSQIVLAFDMDDPGRAAAEECARLFKPGTAFIATFPLKDPNEMLQAGRKADLVQCLWEAKEYRPDGIVTVSELFDQAVKPIERGLPWWSPTLTLHTYGRRYGEVVGLGAGTGIGKTDFVSQQIAYDLGLGHSVGGFMLEQHPVETLKRVAGKMDGRLYHLPDSDQSGLPETLRKMQSGPGQLYLYDNFGATEWPVIRDRMRYLRHAFGVRLFYLDHLTALAAAEDDERKALEQITADMAALNKELQSWTLFVSHLASPEGKSHEEGGRVTIKQFKGSRAIGFWSHFLFGMERDQQSEDAEAQHTTTFRILKDRYSGRGTGKTIPITYDQTTGVQSEGAASTTEGFF